MPVKKDKHSERNRNNIVDFFSKKYFESIFEFSFSFSRFKNLHIPMPLHKFCKAWYLGFEGVLFYRTP